MQHLAQGVLLRVELLLLTLIRLNLLQFQQRVTQQILGTYKIHLRIRQVVQMLMVDLETKYSYVRL